MALKPTPSGHREEVPRLHPPEAAAGHQAVAPAAARGRRQLKHRRLERHRAGLPRQERGGAALGAQRVPLLHTQEYKGAAQGHPHQPPQAV